MKKIKKYPKVLLVGRTNVGKSALFNRLANDTESIILNQEGITRDYVSEVITWADKTFELVDTGGISLKKQSNPITEQVRLKVLELFDKACLIFFMCDGKNGMTAEDMLIAKVLHKTKKPVVLLVNKSDNTRVFEENLPEFCSLGFKNILSISAIHGQGIGSLLDNIVQVVPTSTTEPDSVAPLYQVVILGKPNVGKSSLMNLFSKKERSIITDIAGTTREAISENIHIAQDIIQLTDTAGVRRKSRIKEDDVESLMVKSSLSAIRQADIAVLVIDSSSQKVSDQELKLLFYAFEQKKSLIIAFNKTDLLTDYDRKSFEYNLKEHSFIFKKIPMLWISCKNKKNIDKLYKEVEKAWIRKKQRFINVDLNELVKEKLQEKPMFHKTNRLKLFKIAQTVGPIPTFLLVVNYPEWFGPTQLGFIENLLRKNYDLKGCPVQFNLKRI